MNLKLLIFRARSKGVPVYCCFLCLVYLAYQQTFVRSPPPDPLPEYIQRYPQISEHFSFPTHTMNSAELTKLSSTIEMLNLEHEVLMAERYGELLPDTTVIVVQAQRDVGRLQVLIASLAQVRYIQTVLLVFSHSYYHDIINELVSSITFCRVMQIFYPYSLQLYPDKFPGIDPEDCPSSTGKTDKYCSARDGRLTEHKHHWWWKASFIFNKFDWWDSYTGTVIFLEEDNYVLPDLLHMLRYTKWSKANLQGIDVMSFGRPYGKDLDYDLLSVAAWRPPYDKGLAFNKSVWQKIAAMSSYYCIYDDLSWSYSLLNVFGQFREGRADMVASWAPRVLSTAVFPSGREAHELIRVWLADANLFPLNVKAVMLLSNNGRVENRAQPPPWGNGGWGDLRDHLLCLDPLMVTTTDNTNNLTASFLVNNAAEMN